MQLNQIKLKDRNPRLITDEALSKLADSIKRDPEFMVLRPIVIDDDNIIIGGNQRYKAIQLLGITEIPDSWVLKAANLTQEQINRFVLIDNAPPGMAGDWDLNILRDDWDMAELTNLGFFENQFGDFVPMSFDNISADIDTEINPNSLGDFMFIKLKYSFDEYQAINDKLATLSKSPEELFKEMVFSA